MKPIGRIIARGEKMVGIYMPLGNTDLLDGIYEVRECMGELTIHRIGEPAMPRARFTGLDLNGLMADRPYSVMTEAELKSVTQDDKQNLWHPFLRV